MIPVYKLVFQLFQDHLTLRRWQESQLWDSAQEGTIYILRLAIELIRFEVFRVIFLTIRNF